MKKTVLIIVTLLVIGTLQQGCTTYLDLPTPKGTVTETSQDKQIRPYRPGPHN